MEKRLKIDEVAKQSGLSKRTIRYYEEIGLLEAPPRSKGGTRLYSERHIAFLKKVMTIKEVLGFSLQELQHYMSLRETFERERQDYLQAKDLKDSEKEQEKLVELTKSLDKQIQVIEEKMQKLLSVQSELESLRKRATARLETLETETRIEN